MFLDRDDILKISYSVVNIKVIIRGAFLITNKSNVHDELQNQLRVMTSHYPIIPLSFMYEKLHIKCGNYSSRILVLNGKQILGMLLHFFSVTLCTFGKKNVFKALLISCD